MVDFAIGSGYKPADVVHLRHVGRRVGLERRDLFPLNVEFGDGQRIGWQVKVAGSVAFRRTDGRGRLRPQRNRLLKGKLSRRALYRHRGSIGKFCVGGHDVCRRRMRGCLTEQRLRASGRDDREQSKRVWAHGNYLQVRSSSPQPLNDLILTPCTAFFMRIAM